MGKALNFAKAFIERRGTGISPFAILRGVKYADHVFIGPMAKLERAYIGRCTMIGTLSAVYDAKVGKFCSIAREAYVGGASHPTEYVSTSACFYLKSNRQGICYNETDYQWHTETEIGNDVWIGARAIIKAGIRIGSGAVIGAGSVLTKDVGPYEIWAGNPARLIRKRFDEDTIGKLLEIQWWDWEDGKLMEMGERFPDVEKFIKG